MAMSINKSRSSIIVLLTVLLTGIFCPAMLSAFQEPPPGPPVSDEDREQMLDMIRQRMEQRQQDQGNQQFQRFPPMQQQRQLMQQQLQQLQQIQQGQGTNATSPKAAATQQMSLEPAGTDTLKLNFKDVDLATFIKQISDLLGLTPLVIDSDVQGTVTMYTSEAISKQDLLPLFNLILKQKNAALVEQNGVYQVVPISSGLKSGVDLIDHAPPGDSEETATEPAQGQPNTSLPAARPAAPGQPGNLPLSTHVIRVEFVPAEDLIEPIRLLMTEGGVIMPYDRLNMLILTDYSDSIDRILSIIHLLDNKFMDEELIDLVKIEHNNSSDIVDDLKKLFGSGAEGSNTGIYFVSLDRMNSIFVMANSKRGLTTVKDWIEKLDATTGRNIQTNVYVVRNSTAANIATLLSALYGEGATAQGQNQQGQGIGGLTQTNRNAQSTGTSNQQRGSFGSFTSNTGTNSGTGFNMSGFTNSGININGQQLGPQFTTSTGISSMVIQGGEFSGLQDTVRLVVDDISNRLIIQSTAADYEFILETIEKMDIMPRQVVIDAQVFEVDLTDDLSFGVGVALQERTGSSGTIFGLNLYPNNADQTSFNGALTGGNIALIGSRQELLTAIQALREKTNVKVLESPSVLAMDGTEAHITVGGEVPYAGSIYYQDVNTAQSVSYRDTGVTLYVRPRISASGSVSMELLQEVSGVGSTTSTLGPTFTKSQVQTTLTVKDGQTVAIAGLIRDSEGLTRSGFPLLSDIPIIGSLFGTTARSKKRTELVILITPRVITDPDSHEAFTRELKDSLKNVRKLVDKREEERRENLQDAMKDREKKSLEQTQGEEDLRKQEERELRRKRN
jgi:general secretion pathway protein D